MKTIQLSKGFNIKLDYEVITIFFSNKFVEFKMDEKEIEIDYNKLILPAIFKLVSIEGIIEYPITLKNISCQNTLYISNIPSNKKVLSLKPRQTIIITEQQK